MQTAPAIAIRAAKTYVVVGYANACMLLPTTSPNIPHATNTENTATQPHHALTVGLPVNENKKPRLPSCC